MNNNVKIDKLKLSKTKRTQKSISPLSKYAPLFFLPTAVAFCIGFLFPFLWGVYLSFFQFRTVNKLSFVGLGNYVSALTDKQFWYSFGFSALFTLVTVIIINVAAFTVAYALTRAIKGTNIFRTVFFMPNLIGGIVLGFIWQIILNGILAQYSMNVTSNTQTAFWGLVILTCWQQIGYMMIIYIAALGSVPETLIEAAKIDGATPRKTLFSVTIPMIRPSITICTFLTLTNSFKLYDQNAALITSSNPSIVLENGENIQTAATIARDIVDQFAETYLAANGIAQAKSIIFFLFVVAISIFQLKLTRKGEIQH
jgi:raffinose/stachyose/melibiose transport system permease protein